MGARAFSPAQGTFLTFQRTRFTVINTFMEVYIQWRLYEAARIWRLRVPLENGQNLFRLELPF